MNMKVLLLNGSPHTNGCTAAALNTIATALNRQGIETEILSVGTGVVRDCIACGGCKKGQPVCIFNDDCVNTFITKAQTADAFVFASPVYYAHPTGALLSAMDRIFYAGGQFLRHKPAAAILTARRAGTTASMDVINKYFAINQMPIVTSTYWNQVYRSADFTADAEGTQTLTYLANNLAWLLQCIAAGRTQGIEPPTQTKSVMTNFLS